ncbi:MAG TPA: alpha-L-fucosidase [Chitinophagaceae bacterium]|nr:alpha-L-fucosidase [Chitinophagaceae bacterium]
MKKLRIAFVLALISFGIAQTCFTQRFQTSQRTKWFQESRVGMIVHWGLYSIPAGVWNGRKIPWYGEWIKDKAPISDTDYFKLAAEFNPQKFNAGEWIRMAADAGMKYFCLVTKHHDGFSLWNTKQNDDWNVMDATPFKRDLVKELSDACREQGIVYSLYYSSGLDWHYASVNWALYKKYYYNQLKELLTNYGRIGYIWFDGEWTPQWNEKEAEELYKYVRSLDSNIITNNPKKKSSSAYGDFGIDEENYSPPASDFKKGLWERDRLIQLNTWGYKSWEPWKKSVDLIRDMIDAASLSMNFCLNVGPKSDGSFPPEAIAILKDFGRWLKVNGDAIYNTNGFVKNITLNFDGRITQGASMDSIYYVHVFKRHSKAKSIKITTPLPFTSATTLDSSILLKKPKISRVKGLTVIKIILPMKTDPFATVIKLQIQKRT